MDKKYLKQSVEDGLSTRRIAERFNVSQTTVRYWLKKHELETNFDRRKSWDDSKLTSAVAKAETLSDVLREFGMATGSGNYKSINKAIARLGIDTSHLIGRGSGRGGNARTDAEVFCENSTYSRHGLLRRLLAKGVSEECAVCGVGGEWQGKPLRLQVDHINGVNNDHRLENLRVMCPNCHSQTATWGGKNVL